MEMIEKIEKIDLRETLGEYVTDNFNLALQFFKETSEFLDIALSERNWESDVNEDFWAREYYFHREKVAYVMHKSGETIYRVTAAGKRIIDAAKSFEELNEKVRELNKLWSEVTSDDVIHTHKPFPNEVKRILKLKSETHYSYPPMSWFAKKARELNGIDFFIEKRFRGGDWIFVKVPTNRVVRVSEKRPRWVIGYLIGKGGQRSRELGIRVEII